MAEINLVDASIADLQMTLSTGAVTSVELVARYLRRISRYDCRGPKLNAIPIINPHVFAEAAASDDRRASGQPIRALEGIPYTVKDSYQVKGMTCASGSPAFKDLIASEDAFTVATIREAGGVLIGRTNMPSMAYGGMQRGVYGRAESPYNVDYLAAAFASGSSNGSGVSTASSFAAFGMGEETVSSGRSPASNNALVAYTPSRGWISIRGNWPLYPTCDVVVPHTRTMHDMLLLLQVITTEDYTSRGDFWRDIPFISLPRPFFGRSDVFQNIQKAPVSLNKVRIAIPHMYIGGPSVTGARPVHTSPAVIKLWERARKDLEDLGADIVVVPDFPLVTAYENPALLPDVSPQLPENWSHAERGPLVAHAWNEFLKANQDRNIPDISSLDGLSIYPDSLRTSAELKYMDKRTPIHWSQLASYVRSRLFYETEDLEAAIAALEGMRKRLLDDYLTAYNCDCFVFPAAGDVAASDADVKDESAEHAWRNGVYYSNGNRAIRHLGVPTVTVPMGILEDKAMPVGLTFAGRAYEDANLLLWAKAYEQHSKRRTLPIRTPPLESDTIVLKKSPCTRSVKPRPELKLTRCIAQNVDGDPIKSEVYVEGCVTIKGQLAGHTDFMFPEIEIYIDGDNVPISQIILESCVPSAGRHVFEFKTRYSVERPHATPELAPVARDKIMIVVLTRPAPGAQQTGYLEMIDPSLISLDQ
ncbi:amidase signature domain-containing protein [Camillea tinctor]|nr:amidase signature domain-containing protein [Camillea tinctor]